uniref:Uncharacterized protein n=1 Tax=Siphoviridae sp. ct6d71 TaxID=2826298 RepID=A0A8S5R1Z7_9CAUD|nr:MAG TPA: hypothetical protein [Siphoviridae sp. ct6d71]
MRKAVSHRNAQVVNKYNPPKSAQPLTDNAEGEDVRYTGMETTIR